MPIHVENDILQLCLKDKITAYSCTAYFLPFSIFDVALTGPDQMESKLFPETQSFDYDFGGFGYYPRKDSDFGPQYKLDPIPNA